MQMELFPSAADYEIQQTKKHLEDYRKMQRHLKVYSQKPSLSPKEQELLDKAKRLLPEIDTAFELIMDEEVYDILTHRYKTVGKHKHTIARYVNSTSVRTINRRIDAGIETIAECLKIAGVI